MTFGKNLLNARKKTGLSQEAVAEKLGVSRQTISKWETDETLPDIRQSKNLSVLYHLPLDALVDFDTEEKELERIIKNTSEETLQNIDWSKLWAEQYPVLASYAENVKTDLYAAQLRKLLQQLQSEYGYTDLDAFLVLKDILANLWRASCSSASDRQNPANTRNRIPETSPLRQKAECRESPARFPRC